MTMPRREWLSFLWILRWPFNASMRCVRIATCTSGDPVSPVWVAYCSIRAFFSFRSIGVFLRNKLCPENTPDTPVLYKKHQIKQKNRKLQLESLSEGCYIKCIIHLQWSDDTKITDFSLQCNTLRDNHTILDRLREYVLTEIDCNSIWYRESFEETQEHILALQEGYDWAYIYEFFFFKSIQYVRDSEVSQDSISRHCCEYDFSRDICEAINDPIENIIDEFTTNNRVIYTLFFDKNRRKSIHKIINENSNSSCRGETTSRIVWLKNETHRFELHHIISNSCRRNPEVILLEEILWTHDLPCFDILLDDEFQDLNFSLIDFTHVCIGVRA